MWMDSIVDRLILNRYYRTAIILQSLRDDHLNLKVQSKSTAVFLNHRVEFFRFDFKGNLRFF